MWSKTNQKLQNFLCDSLKGRVRYFITSYRKAHDQTGRGAIIVDGKEVLNACFLNKQVKDYYRSQEISKNPSYIPKYNSELSNLWEAQDMLYKEGLRGDCDFTLAVKSILTKSIDECINSEDYLTRIFAIVDRRMGKKRLLKTKSNYDDMHELEQFFYDLRCEAEGINEKHE